MISTAIISFLAGAFVGMVLTCIIVAGKNGEE